MVIQDYQIALFAIVVMAMWFIVAITEKKKMKSRSEQAWKRIQGMINDAVAEQLKQQNNVEK